MVNNMLWSTRMVHDNTLFSLNEEQNVGNPPSFDILRDINDR